MISEIPAKKAIRAVSAVKKKGAVATLVAVEKKRGAKTMEGVYEIETKFRVKRKNAKLTILETNHSKTIVRVMTFDSGMT